MQYSFAFGTNSIWTATLRHKSLLQINCTLVSSLLCHTVRPGKAGGAGGITDTNLMFLNSIARIVCISAINPIEAMSSWTCAALGQLLPKVRGNNLPVYLAVEWISPIRIQQHWQFEISAHKRIWSKQSALLWVIKLPSWLPKQRYVAILWLVVITIPIFLTFENSYTQYNWILVMPKRNKLRNQIILINLEYRYITCVVFSVSPMSLNIWTVTYMWFIRLRWKQKVIYNKLVLMWCVASIDICSW